MHRLLLSASRVATHRILSQHARTSTRTNKQLLPLSFLIHKRNMCGADDAHHDFCGTDKPKAFAPQVTPLDQAAASASSSHDGKTLEFINQHWEESILPSLCDYIRVPNLSPMFDANILTNGYQEQAMDILVKWVEKQGIKGMKLEVVSLPQRTPLLFIEIDSSHPDQFPADQTVIMYGHMDKQPHMNELWRPDLSPTNPVIQDGKLYGRGGADDGYAIFAAITAIRNLQQQQVPHARYVILIEGAEESGSIDLPANLEVVSDRIGESSLVVILDSGAGDYERLWLTTSLRGLVVAKLKVSVLTEGAHSGKASGIIPDSFRIARHLLDRIENSETGQIHGDAFHCPVPPYRIEEARQHAAIVGDFMYKEFSRVNDLKPVVGDITEQALNRGWRPTLTITGADGLPEVKTAGNLLRPSTTLKLSMRLPPRVDAKAAGEYLKKALSENPPYDAKVEVDIVGAGTGFDCPELAPWLHSSLNVVSSKYYGNGYACLSEGGSIPTAQMLQIKLTKNDKPPMFIVTGLLGPMSNAHSGNEMLPIDYAKKLTCCVSELLEAHSAHVLKSSSQ